MASPPNRTDLAGTPTVATYKLAIGALYDYVASLLGNGTATIASETEKKIARESLGVGNFGFKNRFINPEFSVSQRIGSSSISVGAGGTWVVDRWLAVATGASITAQRIAGISENEYSLRLTGASSNTEAYIRQSIESVNSADFKNKNITVSLKTKASAARTITWEVFYFNVKDNASAVTIIATGTIEINTTVNQHQFSFNAGSNAGNGLLFVFKAGALLAGSTVDFDAMQLEQSSIATEFEKRNYSHELLMCQRYYEEIVGVSTQSKPYYNERPYKVQKRVVPTLTVISGSMGGADYVSDEYNLYSPNNVLATGTVDWRIGATADF